MIKSSAAIHSVGVSLAVSLLLVRSAAAFGPQTTSTPDSSTPSNPPAPPAIGSNDSAAPAPVIRAVSVSGSRDLSSSVLADAAAKAAFGKPGDSDTIHAAVEAIVRVYRERGFPVAAVLATDVSPDGVLRITVAEGTVRNIIVKGNHRTRKITILGAMETRPGTTYREDRARADRDRLARLGIFTDVVISPIVPGSISENDREDSSDSDSGNRDEKKDTGLAVPQAPPPGGATAPSPTPAAPATTPASDAAVPDEDTVGMVDVVVKVKEERTGNVAATVGYSDGMGLTGFVDLSEQNFQGMAQQVSIQWQRSSNGYYQADGSYVGDSARQAFDISFLQPLVGPNSLSYGVDLYNKQTVFFPFFASYNDTIRNYETRRGASVRVGRAVTRNASLYLSARHDKVGYDPVPEDLDPPYDLLATSAATVGALGINLILDGRNEVDNPRHGYLNSLVYEKAGSFMGGDRSFSQTKADLRGYFALNKRVKGPVLATRVMGGTTSGDAPLSEYYFLGGYELLRGYDLYSIYGTKMVLGSVEVRTPISDSVQGVAFIDSGNAYRGGWFSGGLKTGGGLGLRFLSPIGPIRLDVARGDSDIRTYVSLGQSF